MTCYSSMTTSQRDLEPSAPAPTERILSYCLGFETFPERGTRRDDLRPGLRVVGFARRATIAFHVTDNTVTIDRILYRGRDLAAAFPNDQRR